MAPPSRRKASFEIDVQLAPEDLEQLWEPVDSEANEIPAAPAAPEAEPAPPHDPIDWAYIDRAFGGFIGDIVDHWFRGRVVGAEKLPLEGPLIVAPNHSGNAFPHDAVVLDALLFRHVGLAREHKFRSVFTPQLAAVWWMRPYGVDDFWRRGGGVDMTFANFDRLLARGDKVIYYPEGVPGIGKGFLRRYQLQHFHSSFIVLAARHDAPIFPVSVVNAEWVNPTSVTFAPLNALFRKLAGLPFFPIPTVFLAALFPFIFYLGFPCQMTFVIGDPVDVRSLLREEGTDPDRPDRDAVLRVAERIRAMAQERLDDGVRRYGAKPWDVRGLVRHLRSIPGRRLAATPLGWPHAYVRMDRDLHRPPARSRLHALLRDWDILFHFLPLGWIGLALARELRKPPYGYRGMTPEARREREGSFRWLLETRPLPARASSRGEGAKRP